MRKQLLYLLLALALPALFSCQNSSTDEIHDEAMKDLADMNRLSRSMKQELIVMDSLKGFSSTHRDSLVEILAIMSQAEEEMMAWMAQSETPANLSGEAAEKYRKRQKQMIEKNRDDIKKALKMGQKWTGESKR